MDCYKMADSLNSLKTVARKWCHKHVSATTNKHAAKEELLKVAFFYVCGPCQGLIGVGG
jgi:hypothetical protein